MGYKADAIVVSIDRGLDSMFVMGRCGELINDLIGLKNEVKKSELFCDDFLATFEKHIEQLITDTSSIMYNASYQAEGDFNDARRTAKGLEE